MRAILSFLSHPRTRALRRLPAPVVWVTAFAVLFAQGFGPSYAGFAVSTYGSSATVHLNVVAWSNGVPTRVEAYLPDRAQPVVRTIDPDLVRRAAWTETGAPGAWRQGRVSLPGMQGNGAYDVAYRADGQGFEAIASPTGDPAGAIHLQYDGGETMQSPDYLVIVFVALLVCALANDVQQQRCLGNATETCGAGNVKCANYSGGCGIGSCTVQCKGSTDSCN